MMSHQVVSVAADRPFKELVVLLAQNDISALPVVDDQNRPLGVVSEGDLLRNQASRPDPLGHGHPAGPSDPTRIQPEVAADLMTGPAVTARPEWSVVEAASAMERAGVKRLVVVDEIGRLVGIVSRSDLLRVFLRTDRFIREEIVSDVLGRMLQIAEGAVQVQVREGVVTLRGRLGRRSQGMLVVWLSKGVDGVVSVHDLLAFDADDAPVLPEPVTLPAAP
ncbi:CBS domain-containing protein [Streptomyces sp. H39-S7]|uniref:CBS domain-containing protein n=1 Tax=Streptomyces sp. H39-S7 TaxID=3004357 RepID=UPI0022AF4EBD|nr:CBS domain-containing protein [Streptomyces sp. H39-S7]MCZ4124963.1 CBS domain-containing protein [Streptomyces sp. H39-S7]